MCSWARVTGLLENGDLPEHVISQTQWNLPALPAELTTPIGIGFATDASRLLALADTEPYEQFPSRVVLRLDRPRRLAKIYLLTANLYSPVKSYYPAAEVVLHYADSDTGTESGGAVQPLIPPYTFPGACGHTCPRAYALRWGDWAPAPAALDHAGYLSVIDVVADEARSVVALELRCVASETLVGVLGITALESVDQR